MGPPLDERALIAQLEEENNQMIREMTRLETQVNFKEFKLVIRKRQDIKTQVALAKIE